MTESSDTGIIDSNIDLKPFEQEEKKEQNKQKQITNFHLSKTIEGMLVWYGKKIKLTDEEIEEEIKFDEPDKDLVDNALNPLALKIMEILGLDGDEVLALVMLVSVIAPRMIYIFVHKPKQKKEIEIKEVDKNDNK